MRLLRAACSAAVLLAACSSANETATSSRDRPGQGGHDGRIDLEAGLGGASCAFADSTDHDGDGYSFVDGDCNDCDPNVNPGAFDALDDRGAPNGVDEDCDGVADDEPIGCDVGLPLEGPDPLMGARAIGLCRKAEPAATGKDKTWGVLRAQWVLPDGAPERDPVSHGILPNFGVNGPQEGAAMLALSSGTARDPQQPGYHDIYGYNKSYVSGTPAGYPKESPACKGVVTGEAHDGAGLLLTIRVPTNARSFTFNENFFTYEYPEFICDKFNDFFVAILEPTAPGVPDGNISFDQDGNAISVNNSLLQVCVSQSAGNTVKRFFPCPLGAASLFGTGFDGHAATGWLETRAPVTPGSEITLLFTIWDSEDGIFDSTVLIDGFNWSIGEGSGTPTTEPVPAPK